MESHSLPFSSWRSYLAPALLVGVALVQRYMMQNRQLDPWKGGGFGMFSAVSARSLRQLTITLVTSDGTEKRFPPSSIVSRIPLDGDMGLYRQRLLTMPSPSRLQGLANRLAAADWVAIQTQQNNSTNPSNVGQTATSKEDLEANTSTATFEQEYYRMKEDVPKNVNTRLVSLKDVRVEIWQYDLNRDVNQLHLTSLATAAAVPRR